MASLPPDSKLGLIFTNALCCKGAELSPKIRACHEGSAFSFWPDSENTSTPWEELHLWPVIIWAQGDSFISLPSGVGEQRQCTAWSRWTEGATAWSRGRGTGAKGPKKSGGGRLPFPNSAYIWPSVCCFLGGPGSSTTRYAEVNGEYTH